MSEENVEAIRNLYERMARGDFRVIDELGDDIEFVTSPELPDAGTHRGETARKWLREWVGSFEKLTIGGTEFVDAGDRVAVAMVQRGIPRGSVTEVEGRWWFVYTFRDGALIRMQGVPDRAAALEAAGLSE